MNNTETKKPEAKSIMAFYTPKDMKDMKDKVSLGAQTDESKSNVSDRHVLYGSIRGEKVRGELRRTAKIDAQSCAPPSDFFLLFFKTSGPREGPLAIASVVLAKSGVPVMKIKFRDGTKISAFAAKTIPMEILEALGIDTREMQSRMALREIRKNSSNPQLDLQKTAPNKP